MNSKIGRIAIAAAMLAGAGLLSGQALAQAGRGAVMANCREDIAKFCSGVQPGGGRLRPCIRDNYMKFSQACQVALREVVASKRQAPGGAQAAPAPMPMQAAPPPAIAAPEPVAPAEPPKQ